jgi:hypothetical protein
MNFKLGVEIEEMNINIQNLSNLRFNYFRLEFEVNAKTFK